jgi:tetratricopeptide (TPR) repeat protein
MVLVGLIAACTAIYPPPANATAWGMVDKAGPFRNVRCSVEDPPEKRAELCTSILEHVSPDDRANALTIRASAYESLGEFDKAIRDYDEIVGLRPMEASAFDGRCWARAVWGQQLDVALGDCNAAIGLSTKNSDYFDSRAFVYFRMQDYAHAITDDNSALSSNPRQAGSLFVRGLSKIHIQDFIGGQKDIASALEIDPTLMQTYAGYGVKF